MCYRGQYALMQMAAHGSLRQGSFLKFGLPSYNVSVLC